MRCSTVNMRCTCDVCIFIDVREHFHQGHQSPFLDRRQAKTDTDIHCKASKN